MGNQEWTPENHTPQDIVQRQTKQKTQHRKLKKMINTDPTSVITT